MLQTKPFKKTDKQIVAIKLLSGKALHILFHGGSRSAKSLIHCYALLVRSFKRKSRHVIFRQHFKDAKASIGRETMPKLLSLVCPDVPVKLDKTEWFWTFPNGSEIWLGGLDKKDRTEKVLGKEYSTIVFEEASQMDFDSRETAMTRLAENSGLDLKAYYNCNPPMKKHWLHKLFFEHVDPSSNESLDPNDFSELQMNPEDNKENLPPGYIENVLNKLTDRKRRRFLKGEWLDDVEGALWDQDLISAYRVKEAPELIRIVVGVDPAVSANPKSNETGIVAAGLGEDGHAYILGDKSLVGTPLQWGRAVVGMYLDLQANSVIGEVNNGGDLVESNLRTVHAGLAYKAVHATRGKYIRAEPIAGRYEQGMVHHVGQLPELEDEMCSWEPADTNAPSPNRVDALVWALTELGVGSMMPTVMAAVPESIIDDESSEDLDALMAQMTPEEKIKAMRMREEMRL